MNRRKFLKAIGLTALSTSIINANIISEPEICTIQPELPTLSESKHLNRVGMTRTEVNDNYWSTKAIKEAKDENIFNAFEIEDEVADYGFSMQYTPRKLDLS